MNDHAHDPAKNWSAVELQQHLAQHHSTEATDGLVHIHSRLHAQAEIIWDPEAEMLRVLKQILDAEIWVIQKWDTLPEEHRLVILHALTNEESLAMAAWRAER